MASAVVDNAPGSLPTCTIGGQADIDVIVGISSGTPDRYDVGFFIGENGNDPQLNSGLCSVASFPTSPLPFYNDPADNDLCGDFKGSGVAHPTIFQVKIACNFGTNPADPLTYGKLLFPYVLSYDNTKGPGCSTANDVKANTSSKCSAGVGSVSGITLTGYVGITKQTIPDGDPTVFDFTTTGTAVLSNPLDATFTLIDGQRKQISTIVDTVTKTMTITETSAIGWSTTASIVCLDVLGNPATAFVTTNGTTRTFTASLDIAHPVAECTITNTKGVPLTVHKTWTNAIVGNAVTVSTTGGTNNANLNSVADTASETDDGTPVVVASGDVITLAENFTTGSAANYTATLNCTGNANAVVNNVLTVAPADTAINCTWTNARKSATLAVAKTWANAVVGDAVNVSASGGANTATLSSTAGTPSETDTGATVTAFAGETFTITELFTTGLPSIYSSSLACTGNTTPLAGNVLTVNGADTAIVCTETNARTPVTLTLRKTWQNAIIGNAVTVSTTGALNAATLNSTADTANETDTAAASVNVFAGEAITIGEIFGTGSANSYNTSLACTGNGTAVSNNTLTVKAGDTAIVCTVTNARKSASLTLRKSWLNATVGDAVTVSTAGASNPATLNSVAGTPTEIDTGLSATVFVGEAITISENFTVGSSANYVSTLSCTGNGTVLNGSVLTVNAADTAIVCTELNSRQSASLTLRKTWQNAIVGNAVTVSGTGGTNTATLNSVAGAPNETDTGSSVTIFAGEVITLGENFTTGSALNYTSSLACTGLGAGTTLVGNTLTIGATPGNVVCTETNARKSATLTIAKTWQNAIVGNAVTVSSSGGTNTATVASTANTANETDTGSAATVFAGESLTIGEVFNTGSAGNYAASLACSGNGTALAGNVLTVNPADTAITCTETNARRSTTLTLRKTWVSANIGNAVTVSTAGAINNGTLNSVADTASESDTGAAKTVFAGEAITISESFTNGSAAGYAAVLTCSGNSVALAGNVLTVSANDEGILCTETNTRTSTTLTLRKTWVNATVNNAVTVSTVGATNNGNLNSVAGTPSETDTGAANAVFVGEHITISESFTVGSAGAYTSVLTCTGNQTALNGNVLTVTTGDGPIICAETNSRILRPQLTVTKTATPTIFIVEQPASYAVTVQNTGEAATSGNITLSDTLLTGITLTSATGTNWSCTGTPVLSCTFTGTLAPGASTTVTLNVAVGETATSGNNSATASGGGDATCPETGRCTGTVQVPIQPRGVSLSIVKSANPVRVNAGSLVLYTLTITNIVNYPVVGAQVIDMPPNGLAYVPGSGTIYDSNSANNGVSGARPITFSGVDVAVGQTIRIQYLLRAGAALAAGEYTNFAQAYLRGQPISNVASTTVYAETGADPLLEQTRILGKVWDDQNGDGWQDAGERGIPGVRIASVDGLISETDAYGRYHIEGIVLLNQERGKNFILKLDPSTLPPGSTLTTENPLVRRVTAAIPARFDFGVKMPPSPMTASDSVDMALGEINFTPGSTEIRPEYQSVLDGMADKIRTHQSGEVFIDSASGSSPLAFERAGRVRDQLIERLSPEQRNAFVITLRLQASDGSTGEVSISDVVKLGEVLFDTDKSVIKPEFDPLLDKIAAAIEAVGAGRVTVVGHADLRGSVEYNQALGLRRANAVFDSISKRLSPEARSKLSVDVEGAAQVPGAGQ